MTARMSTLPQNIIIHVDYSLQSENVVKCKQREWLILVDILFSLYARGVGKKRECRMRECANG